MERPDFEKIKSGREFNQWYWLKDEMVEICKLSNLPTIGRKFDLRDRIMFALDNDGKIKSKSLAHKPKSKFNWAKSELTLKTEITDNISFGPNFRKFMKSQIGDNFTCNSDFMDWVKSNIGKTLECSIKEYHRLEKRKDDPDFRRNIADNNMFNQYMRDFMEDNPNQSLESVRKFWMLKKRRPMKNGFVKYDKSDLLLGEK